MKAGSSTIVIDNTNIKTRDYRKYVEEAQQYGYTVFQKTFKSQFKNVHSVPDDVVQRMKDSFQDDQNLAFWPEKEEK